MMSDRDEMIQAISVGIAAANYLFGTCRVLKAIELYKECLLILYNLSASLNEITRLFFKALHWNLLHAHYVTSEYTSAIKHARKLLHIYREFGERPGECIVGVTLATMYFRLSKYVNAKECCKEALLIAREIGDTMREASCYEMLGLLHHSVGKNKKTPEFLEKSLLIRKELGDGNGVASCYANLGTVLLSLSDYKKSKKYFEMALSITKETGDKRGKASCYGGLGILFQSFGEFEKAKQFHEKALAITKELGDRNGEASCYVNLGTLFESIDECQRARENHEKALAIWKENGDRQGEATTYGNLGTVYLRLCEYVKAKELLEKALTIQTEVGDRKGEAMANGNLGAVFLSLGDYDMAKDCLEKALFITKDIGDRAAQASCYGNLGTVFRSIGDYANAKEHFERALKINKEIGNRNGEATCWASLGTVLQLVGEYDKAKEYGERALAIKQEIGDRNGEASCYRNLGIVFQSVDDYDKAREYHEKALAIQKDIGDKAGEACSFENLGILFQSLGKYSNCNEYYQKALMIRKELGDRRGEASIYGHLGVLFQSLGDYTKSKHFHERAMVMRKELGDKEGEALDYLNLGHVFLVLAEYDNAEENYKRGLSITEETGHRKKQIYFLCGLALVKLVEGKIQESLSYLLSAVQQCEDLRAFLGENEDFKISLSDQHCFSYWMLSALLMADGNPIEALYVAELGRARALADILSTQYSLENQISTEPRYRPRNERNVTGNGCNCTCLYIHYSFPPSLSILFWVLKKSGGIHFKHENFDPIYSQRGLALSLDEVFTSLRSFHFLPEEDCEDRSLSANQRNPALGENERSDVLETRKSNSSQEPNMDLSLCYKMIIAPVVDLLQGPEIVIVPERSLYNIPFAALPDENGEYLSENFRIRIVPSLITLQLIEDSPADYHSQTGALIVGNPDVGRVRYKGRLKNITRLPRAENEARMVGEKLGVKPLLGRQATKQTVLQRINSVSLIHFAAHGNAERGEIALAPSLRIPNRIPREEDYLLTMTDISEVQLRAKLVVLSCCHSGSGEARAEGVVGIARAFIASGARSVLVALWAIEDTATELLMTRFYEHLLDGESASESLHEAMKWMRRNGYSELRQWAPFILIGDNVTFDFGKAKRYQCKSDYCHPEA